MLSFNNTLVDSPRSNFVKHSYSLKYNPHTFLITGYFQGKGINFELGHTRCALLINKDYQKLK